jgi:hypothetical protein
MRTIGKTKFYCRYCGFDVIYEGDVTRFTEQTLCPVRDGDFCEGKRRTLRARAHIRMMKRVRPMKFQVTGTITFNFDIEVDAASEDEAAEKAEEMDYAGLLETAPIPRVDVEGCNEVKAAPRAQRKRR